MYGAPPSESAPHRKIFGDEVCAKAGANIPSQPIKHITAAKIFVAAKLRWLLQHRQKNAIKLRLFLGLNAEATPKKILARFMVISQGIVENCAGGISLRKLT
jgi:hypothetical protein